MKKIIGLSLATAIAATSAFAVDFKADFSGDMKAYYNTTSQGNGSMFDKDSSVANIGLSLDADFSIGDTTNVGVKAIFLDTAGLEGSLTNGEMQNSADTLAITEAYIAKRFGNTGIIMGRQEMTTPMLFSEKQTQTPYATTVNAFTVMNKSIPGYTFVGSLVGGTNDNLNMSKFDDSNMGGSTYVVGALMAPFQDVLANVWYYKTDTNMGEEDVVWGDVEVKTFIDAMLYGQAAMVTMDSGAETMMYGVKATYDFEGVSLTGAYNYVDMEAGSRDMKNRATNNRSSLYTEMYDNTALIAGTDGEAVDSIMFSAEKEMGQMNLKVAYGTNFDATAYDFVANTQIDDIDLDLVVSLADNDMGTYGQFGFFATYRF